MKRLMWALSLSKDLCRAMSKKSLKSAMFALANVCKIFLCRRGNVCGVAVIFLAAIASCALNLWRDLFLDNNARFPDDLKWILHSTSYSDLMRSKVISWLLWDRVEVASLGIIDSQSEYKVAVSGVNIFPDGAGPGDRSRSSKRFLNEDIDVFKISDDNIKSCCSNVT